MNVTNFVIISIYLDNLNILCMNFFECKEALHYNKLKEMAKGLARKEENLKFQEQTIINNKNDLM